jgi:hypothetical protein
MLRQWTVCLAASIWLAGATNYAAADMFSAKRVVLAMLADELFVGEAEGRLSGSGTIAMYSRKDPAITCTGQFTSSATAGGGGQMQCNDGTTATFTFQRQSMLRGNGAGHSSRGAMTFAYGLTAEEAVPHLKLPQGKKITYQANEVALADL